MDHHLKVSRFTDPAINHNSIVVFPNGLMAGNLPEKCWEGPRGCDNGRSDIVFVTAILKLMRDNYCIDNNRIYASGHSIGAGFVNLLAYSPLGQDLAAFAMNAAILHPEADGSECTPPRSYSPILELHGTQDQTAKYHGDTSQGASLPSIRILLNTWATRNGCNSSPVPVIDEYRDGNTYYTQYNCGWRKGTVIGYNVTG